MAKSACGYARAKAHVSAESACNYASQMAGLEEDGWNMRWLGALGHLGYKITNVRPATYGTPQCPIMAVHPQRNDRVWSGWPKGEWFVVPIDDAPMTLEWPARRLSHV